jgi:hypothetical protein
LPCFLGLLALGPRPGSAAGLYRGEVPVDSQTDAARVEALKAALAQVLIRLTGEQAVLARTEVAKALAGAERYVQQYQYEQDVVNEGGQPRVRLRLVAEFDRDAVDQLLRDLGLAAAKGVAESAPLDGKAMSYRVWVSGLHTADDYARAVSALSRNELVRSVRAERAQGDGVALQIEVIGSLSRLLSSLPEGSLRVINARPPLEGIDALLDLVP